MNINNYIKKLTDDEKMDSSFLHLTANENIISDTARSFLNSGLGGRYFFGGGDNDSIVDTGSYTCLGYKGVETIVNAATKSTGKMLNAADVNLGLLSGVHAMMSSVISTTEPGDTVMSVPLEFGGHFATAEIIKSIGRKHVFADFNIDELKFDTKRIKETVDRENVRELYLDVSYYLNPHNVKEIRQAVGKDTIIIYDASHTLGLIMAGSFQSPLTEGADIITANTHKTLPGPHRGLIAFKDRNLAIKANKIIDSCLYSTRHTNQLIALAITILEVEKFGKKYAEQIIKNSNVMAKTFEELGYKVRKANTGRYSENHQIHIFIDKKDNYKQMYKNLIRNNIDTNFQGFELSGGEWYMRIGTAEVTRKGMGADEMKLIAELINKAFKGEDVKDRIIELNKKFSKIYYSFD